MTSARERLTLASILALATALRLYALGGPSLWLDEAYSLRDIAGVAGHNGARPLYFLLLRPWAMLSGGDAWMRLPSALFGVAAVHATYRLARLREGPAVALLSGLLLALSPLAVDHSQQVRMYMLGLLLGVLGSWALECALARPTAGRPLLWGVLRLMVVATAPLNGTLLLADAWLISRRFRGEVAVLSRFAAASVVLVLWLPLLFRSLLDPNLGSATSWMQVVPPPGPGALLARAASLTAAWPIEPWQSHPAFSSATQAFTYFGFAGLVVGLSLFALAKRSARVRLAPAAAWCAIPLAAIAVGSWVGPRSIWLDRVLLFTSPYLVILVAAGLRKLHAQRRRAFLLAALAYVGFLGSALRSYYVHPPREDWKGVAAAVDARAHPGDRIVLLPAFTAPVLERYLVTPWRGETAQLDVEKGFAAEAARLEVRRLAAHPGRSFLIVFRFGPEERWTFLGAIDSDANVIWRERFAKIDAYLFDGPPRVASARAASGASWISTRSNESWTWVTPSQGDTMYRTSTIAR